MACKAKKAQVDEIQLGLDEYDEECAQEQSEKDRRQEIINFYTEIVGDCEGVSFEDMEYRYRLEHDEEFLNREMKKANRQFKKLPGFA